MNSQTETEKIPCACGCGRTFPKNSHGRKYFSPDCSYRICKSNKQTRWNMLKEMILQVVNGERTISNLRHLVRSTYEWNKITKYMGENPNMKRLGFYQKRRND